MEPAVKSSNFAAAAFRFAVASAAAPWGLLRLNRSLLNVKQTKEIKFVVLLTETLVHPNERSKKETAAAATAATTQLQQQQQADNCNNSSKQTIAAIATNRQLQQGGRYVSS